MPSPLQIAGASVDPSKWAPLHMGRFSTGLWSNRIALRDAATSYWQEKYSGPRGDALLDGGNCEISSRLSLIRRPGSTVYNSANLPPINRFYEFRAFSTTTEQILILGDTATDVRDVTGPDRNIVIRTKAAGAGRTSFQSVGNTVYMGDGVTTSKWVQSTLSWAPNKAFLPGDYIIDPAGNIQQVSPALTASIISVSITGNELFLSFTGPSPFPLGSTVTPNGLTTLPQLNGVQMVDVGTLAQNVLVAVYEHPDLATTGETGTVSTAPPTITGAVAPTWCQTIGNVTFDGGILWVNKGNAVQAWGPVGPSTAPSVAPTRLPSLYPSWTASTIYSASLSIVDGNGYTQILTTSGMTGSAEPAWSTAQGAVTADGTARWTNRGLAAWQASHSYEVGDTISVTFTYYIDTGYNQYSDNGQGYNYVDQETPVTVTDTFRCTQAGYSGVVQPGWVDGVGTVVADGINILWTNLGATGTWATEVGANTGVSLAQTIVDANGNLQKIQGIGKSGLVAPDWATTPIGATTQDGSATWTLGLPYSAPADLPQTYTYAFGISVTGERSNASPASVPILVGANSLITVQALGSTNPSVDTIHIYRTTRGGSTQFYLASIPAPVGGGLWSYYDKSADSALTIQIQAATASQLTPPPAGAVAPSYHLQRLFVSVQNVLHWSAGPDAIIYAASGNSGFPPLNTMVFPSSIVKHWPCALGLMVWTVSDIYLVAGSATDTDPLYPVPFLEGIGLIGYDAFTVQGSTAHFITPSLQLLSLDPSAGVTETGFPIADRIQFYFGPTSSLAFHSQSSSDNALYAGDGELGWFRMAPTSAPEQGANWSPMAQIAAGCGALASVEVSPGQRRLLIAPREGGPILKRDATVNTDNGTAYAMSAVVGSVRLAVPGMLAELGFITLESLRIGSEVRLSILMGEVEGRFERLRRTRQDPPLLPPATSLRTDRYHVVQNGNSAYCHHFLMQLTWPMEDKATELIGYTVNGALMNERAGS